MAPFHENLRGIAAVSACNLLFLLNDTVIKLANSELPLGEILTVRGVFASLLLLPLVTATGSWRHSRDLWSWPVFWRTVAEIVAASLYLLGLFHIPIANANAILQAVPLMVTAAGAIFLGEVVGWRRWTAIAVGFAGVMVVVRPGLAGFNVYSLFTLAAVSFIALRDITSRIMPRGLPALLVGFLTAVAVTLAGPLIGWVLGEHWVMPSGHDLALVAGAAVFLIGGYVTSIWFMRHGDIGVVAPFRYTVIIWAMIVGFLVWGERPDRAMLIGTAIIIGTGIYTFHRERRLAWAAARAAT